MSEHRNIRLIPQAVAPIEPVSSAVDAFAEAAQATGLVLRWDGHGLRGVDYPPGVGPRPCDHVGSCGCPGLEDP